MTNYVKVLQVNYVGSEWAINNNDDYSSLQWFSNTPKPTQEELDALWPATEEAEAKSACKQQAVALLQATDWTTIPDVANPAVSTPYLTNQSAFAAYRSQVRALAVNPVADPVFPSQPSAQWSE